MIIYILKDTKMQWLPILQKTTNVYIMETPVSKIKTLLYFDWLKYRISFIYDRL